LSYTSDDGRHEGWEAAEFPDGRVSGSMIGGKGVGIRTLEEATGGGGTWPQEVTDGSTAIGWRGVCTCGWAGPLFRRVPAAGQHDLARHQVHADPGLYADAPPDVADAILAEWTAHLPHETLAEVTAAAEDARKAESRLNDAVAAARAASQTWEAIGRAAGMTRQSANERWRATTTQDLLHDRK
jgi:hypothetical protein